MIREDTGSGSATRSRGGTGRRAMWQWIHSSGSAAVNGEAHVGLSGTT